ncbi:anti-sigma factor [Microbacterium terricola]|uniref:Anti-sigma K factor RskA C-terminal domain-containing protein n=1 Tax=Microbacterium terricola TaxID=344163 RepID=A0ABM8E1S2_9MICO|nr:anti-sigma factor [Microbacterium terricola]UYK40384.1 anti-sigma factor [Microbacterium terricola]BDV31898.1 hypothetical protein Microterr_25580 [Microbacterium terricola]
MSHLDPDQLALLALGEPVGSPEDLAHLASCRQCSDELAQLSRTVQIARSTISDDELESPPPQVWAGIAAELGLGAAEPETTRAPRRGVRTAWILAAALVAVAGIGAGIWAVVVPPAPVTVASATLDAFPDHPTAAGTADVDRTADGTRRLVVTLDASTPETEYREVWLIRNDAQALISLGVLDGDEGSFPIPDGVDLAEYSLVDISVEPLDGDPAHSGDSIVRGELVQRG